jgi:uncharacterized protein (TIGR00369 family)
VTIQTLITQARATGDWRPVLEAVPYFRFMGIDVDVRQGRLEARLAFSEHLVGNPLLPALHGGTLGALLEAVAQCELLYRAESVVLPKTITLTIDYLRSAKPVDTFAVAEVLKQGRRVATVQARAFQKDATVAEGAGSPNLIAVATVHLLVRGS